MATDVDICNLALARLGDEAAVLSINPPDPSAQAGHCARFYPRALSTLQDMHPWGFCTTRVTLAQLTVTPASGWLYTFAEPPDSVSVLALFVAGAVDDFNPQQFEIEQLVDGTSVIYANILAPVCRYTRNVQNAAQFPPLFATALEWLLASYLAGPVLKGAAGRQASKDCYNTFRMALGDATASDAQQRLVKPTQRVAWMTDRMGSTDPYASMPLASR